MKTKNTIKSMTHHYRWTLPSRQRRPPRRRRRLFRSARGGRWARRLLGSFGSRVARGGARGGRGGRAGTWRGAFGGGGSTGGRGGGRSFDYREDNEKIFWISLSLSLCLPLGVWGLATGSFRRGFKGLLSAGFKPEVFLFFFHPLQKL